MPLSLQNPHYGRTADNLNAVPLAFTLLHLQACKQVSDAACRHAGTHACVHACMRACGHNAARTGTNACMHACMLAEVRARLQQRINAVERG